MALGPTFELTYSNDTTHYRVFNVKVKGEEKQEYIDEASPYAAL